jgi:hypothetical protein
MHAAHAATPVTNCEQGNHLRERASTAVISADVSVPGFTASLHCMRRLTDKRSRRAIYSAASCMDGTYRSTEQKGTADAARRSRRIANVGCPALRRMIS